MVKADRSDYPISACTLPNNDLSSAGRRLSRLPISSQLCNLFARQRIPNFLHKVCSVGHSGSGSSEKEGPEHFRGKSLAIVHHVDIIEGSFEAEKQMPPDKPLPPASPSGSNR